MDRTIAKWELILGCIVCFFITFTVSMPRVVFHPSSMAEELSDALAGDMASVLNQYLMGVGEFIGIKSQIEDEDAAELSEMICEKLQEGFFGSKSCEITSLDILRLDRTVLKEVIDEAFLEFDREYKIQLSDIIDSENLSKVLYQSVKKEMGLLKITLALLYGVPLLLAALYITAYLGRKRRRLAVCFTVGYIFAGFAAQLFWCMRLPCIITDVFHEQSEGFVENLAARLQESVERKFSKSSILGGLVGGAADGLIQDNFVAPMLSMCRHMGDILEDALKDSFGSGVWLHFVLLILLFGWCLWEMRGIFSKKQPEGSYGTGADVPVGNRYVGDGRQERDGSVRGGPAGYGGQGSGGFARNRPAGYGGQESGGFVGNSSVGYGGQGSGGFAGNRPAGYGGQGNGGFVENGSAVYGGQGSGDFVRNGPAGGEGQGNERFVRNGPAGEQGWGDEAFGGNGYLNNGGDRAVPPGKRGMGVIRITGGEFAGAAFRVSGGKPVIIGSNPAQAQLVFSGIAERHCKIQFRPETGTYSIYSCVRGGVALADGSFLPAGRPLQLPVGTQIILGMPGNGRGGYTECLWLG